MLRCMMIAVLMPAVLSTSLFAQDDAKKPKKKQKNGAEARLSKQMMTHFSVAKMTEDQVASAKKILAEGMDEWVKLQKEVEAMFTKDQRKTRNETMKQARADGMSQKDATAKANEAVGMDADSVKAFNAKKGEQNKLANALRKKITGLLTDDQKELMKAKQKRGKKGGKKGAKKGAGGK